MTKTKLGKIVKVEKKNHKRNAKSIEQKGEEEKGREERKC